MLADEGGTGSRALVDAVDEVGDQANGHLCYTTGRTRELWVEAFWMEAVLPPPEAKRDGRYIAEAAEAGEARAEGLHGGHATALVE
jgi:hypothetical protein